MSEYQLTAVGHIQSPYKQKFAIPRQPRLVPEAKAKLVFSSDFNREEFVRETSMNLAIFGYYSDFMKPQIKAIQQW